MNIPIAHGAVASGSPLYDASPEHVAAVLALVLLAGVWWSRRTSWASLAPTDGLLIALLAGSAAIHAGLAIGHAGHDTLIRVLFVTDAAALGWTARRVAGGRGAGRLGALVLLGSIAAYWVSAIGGEAPDQIGIATKLGEILALAMVVRPGPSVRRRALRSAAGSLALGLLVIVTAASAWAGAFRASAADPDAVAGHHVHGGSVPPPGTVMPTQAERAVTPADRAAVDEFVQATRVALAPYADPARAAADGYRVGGMHGIDFHAPNPSHENDGRVLDPARPETLVYAVAPDGRPVLLGALFQMPRIGESGPAIGGPLTVWHAHEHVCVSLTPPGLTGLLGPLGTCPVGSIDVPLTSEMIHVWIVPGAPEAFGDLDEAWKRAYLEAIARRS
ncbi:MAG TPA: hypothetical protein VFM06_10365 [Candidatus Limnocylindria bacterium]|nr:hypothetical protein [Candidatus Limnocylindria bacterium]